MAIARCHWCGGLPDPNRICPHKDARPDYQRTGGRPPRGELTPRAQAVALSRRRSPKTFHPVEDPGIGPARLTPTTIIGQYVLWHITAICEMRCLLCQDAVDYLMRVGSVPAELQRYLELQTNAAPSWATKPNPA